MKMGGKFFLLVVLLAFALSFISASCTVTLDKTSYIAGETATAAMSCSLNGEKNTAYTLMWAYQNGTSVENDTGTTPSVAGQSFYESYTIPLTWPNGIFLNASMNGTGLTITQNDSANVTAFGSASNTTLEILNTTFGGGYLGLVSSVKAAINDENGKKISGGLCKITGLSNDENKVLLEVSTIPINGRIEISDILSPTRFVEGTDYAYEINCYCGSAGSSTECIDEDGTSITNSIGVAKNFFTTQTWISVNTVTDKSLYGLKENIFVCANVTNVNYLSRIPLNIYYQIRCSKGTDSNDDRDRILIDYNYENDPDARGISSNTTQMQCKKFEIPEEEYLMGSNSECYASTNVWVLDNSHKEVLGYATTSSVFNISSNELNLQGDWQWISDTTINSIINLSTYNDLEGTGTGNIDVRLFVGSGVNLENIFNIANFISNVTVKNSTTTLVEHTDYELEFLDDGYVELEIKNTSLSSNWFNITLDFYDNDLRQTIALEGIENKTGTFHLAVECPSYATAGSDITCELSAQVEDSQIVEKEVDFTCYLYDGSTNYNSLNFNQMINHTPFTVNKTITVPSTFTGTQNYIFQCEAGYYNLGSRTDYFYDSFVTNYASSSSTGSTISEGGSNPITGGAIAELPEEDKNGNGIPDSEEENPRFLSGTALTKILKILSVIAILILIFVIISAIKSQSILKNKFAKIFFTVLIVVGIIIGVIYLFKIPVVSETSKKIIQDSLFRGMILTAFIALVIAFLSKILNIRGEIKFGRDKLYDRYDRSIREQHKINKEILKHELEHKKKFKNYRIVKVRK